MDWRRGWDDDVDTEEEKLQRQSIGTTRWSRDIHFRSWAGEEEPSAEAFAQHLHERGAPEELDDFLSMNAATQWLLDNEVAEMQEGP